MGLFDDAGFSVSDEMRLEISRAVMKIEEEYHIAPHVAEFVSLDKIIASVWLDGAQWAYEKEKRHKND